MRMTSGLKSILPIIAIYQNKKQPPPHKKKPKAKWQHYVQKFEIYYYSVLGDSPSFLCVELQHFLLLGLFRLFGLVQTDGK